jgi:hypothetical protein
MHYWVANQLAWAMPGYFSTAIGFHEIGTIIWQFSSFRTLACRVNAGVFEQQDGVLANARHYLGVHLLLECKTICIRQKVWVEGDFFESRHD